MQIAKPTGGNPILLFGPMERETDGKSTKMLNRQISVSRTRSPPVWVCGWVAMKSGVEEREGTGMLDGGCGTVESSRVTIGKKVRGRRREPHRHEVQYRLDTCARWFGPLLGFTSTFFAGFTIVAGFTGKIA